MNNDSMQPLIDDRTINPTFLFDPPGFSAGYNRAIDTSMLTAANDWEAILEFLHEYNDTPQTFRSYCKELERFALWLIHDLQKSLSDLKRTDWQNYIAFLEHPKPVRIWCGPKQRKFTKTGEINPRWRPFEKRTRTMPTDIDHYEELTLYGLGQTSINKSRKIIESFFSYLVDNGYLNGNPVLARRKRNRNAHSKHSVKQRFLEIELIDYAVDKLYSLQKKAKPEDRFKYIRARYIILLLANTGLRIEESATHKMGDIYKRNRKWILSIVGKGGKPREIELLPEFMNILKEFREDIGLSSPAPVHNEKTALIPRENLIDTISARRIDQILDWAFGLVANEMKQDAKALKSTDAETFAEMLHQASKLESASAHWLRHSHATYYLKKTGNLKSVMERLGHADVSTTMIYQHVLDSYEN